jgi:hypothetical protein
MRKKNAGDCEGRSEHVRGSAEHAVQSEVAGVNGGGLRDEQHEPQQPKSGVQMRVPIDARKRAREIQGPKRHDDEWDRGSHDDACSLRHVPKTRRFACWA